MSGPIEAIRVAFSSARLAHECGREGCKKILEKDHCKVDLAGAPAPHVIVDFDGREAHQARCDYLFVADGDNDGPGWVAPLELTNGTKGESKAIKQLKKGAEFAAYWIPAKVKVKFRPVLVGKLKPSKKSGLRKAIFIFHDQKVVMRRINCGDRLSKELK